MTLTVKEKEHWKKRISMKINRRIDTLLASERPNYLKDVQVLAETKAAESLGLSKHIARKHEIDETIKQLGIEKESILLDSAALVSEQSRDGLRNKSTWHLESLVNDAMSRAAKVAQHDLMSKDELGKQILLLQNEQEELLDTVWLATSPKQIRALWEVITSLIEQNPTALQQAALETDPPCNNDQ